MSTNIAADDIPSDIPPILTPQEVADLFRVPARTVMYWRNDPRVPLTGSKVGRHVRFTRDEVLAFLKAGAA